MMSEFEEQSEALQGPTWLTGFFQFMNTPAGFGIWYSPGDLASTLLTFADWQYGEGPKPYEDPDRTRGNAEHVSLHDQPTPGFRGVWRRGVRGQTPPSRICSASTGLQSQFVDVLNSGQQPRRTPGLDHG